VREEVADLVRQRDRDLLVLDPDVDVEPEDEVGPRQVLHVVDDGRVALVVGDRLGGPVGERMGAGGDDAQAAPPREPIQLAAHLGELCPDLVDVLADGGPDLDHRLVHLLAHALAEDGLAALLHDLADVGAEVAALGVDDLVLLLHAEGELFVDHLERLAAKPSPCPAGRGRGVSRNCRKGKPSWLVRPSRAQAMTKLAIASTTIRKCLGRMECTSMSGAGW
jgi:hypothetical protein